MTIKRVHGGPKCGANKKQGRGICEQGAGWGTDHPGDGRCKLHGGKSPRGPASASFKTGKHSKWFEEFFGGVLLKGYLRAQTEEELVSLEEQIRVWTAREHELVARLKDHGETAKAWLRCRALVPQLVKLRSGKPTAAKESAIGDRLQELETIVLNAATHETAWQDIAACHELLARLKTAEARKRESEHLMISVDQAMQLGAIIAAVAMQAITERARLTEFVEKMRLLSQGRAVEIDPSLMRRLPFTKR